ncbi:MAG: nitroreductase [Desulfuromonas sp.]|nr:MAG: nitroreductase [Desulfuromonas sp.]
MLQFNIDQNRCTCCGQCAVDCPLNVITLDEGFPRIRPNRDTACIKCQHCLAICPTAALSILGHSPETSRPTLGTFPNADQLEQLIKGRRSVRHYKPDNLPATLIQRLVDVACHAPTGVNRQQVQFSIIDDRQALVQFREHTYLKLQELITAGKLPKKRKRFELFTSLWFDSGIDVLFRNAPHLVVTSAPETCPTPHQDSLIALSYFELYAQSLDIGTIWNGLVTWTIDELVPELQHRLKIPPDNTLGYVMGFGAPAVNYHRTVEQRTANLVRVTG